MCLPKFCRHDQMMTLCFTPGKMQNVGARAEAAVPASPPGCSSVWNALIGGPFGWLKIMRDLFFDSILWTC